MFVSVYIYIYIYIYIVYICVCQCFAGEPAGDGVQSDPGLPDQQVSHDAQQGGPGGQPAGARHDLRV